MGILRYNSTHSYLLPPDGLQYRMHQLASGSTHVSKPFLLVTSGLDLIKNCINKIMSSSEEAGRAPIKSSSRVAISEATADTDLCPDLECQYVDVFSITS